MPKTSSVPELLSPAGDWDAMRAAVSNGADSVYFGLDHFNARHRATNFRLDELPAIVAYLHGHNVKGFLTFNTLIFSDELPAATDYIKAIAAAGVDAVIVQDLGLVRLIKSVAPTLPVHGSTQMTLTEPRGIGFVKRLGVERVVVARELSVDDIAKITAVTDMPLEVFIHGALCVAYSGQCLTSEALGGRSANRGQCAQACRLPYELVVDGITKDLGDKAYLLSPQDLAAHALVDDLAKVGVASLKIEGRLKSAHYVAATTQTYRSALDAVGTPFRLSPQGRADLDQTFSRGFTHGFLSGVNHQVLVAARFPKSRGRRVGVVRSVSRRGVSIDASIELKPGDGVVFDQGRPDQPEAGGRVFAVRNVGRLVEIELGDVDLRAVSIGAIVWKTDDPAMKKRLEQSYSRDVVARRRPLSVEVSAKVGERLSITFRDGDQAVTVEGDKPLERANKFPFDDATAREQLSRLGDTPYELDRLTAEIVGGPMVPKSVLNDLRRRGVESLSKLRERSHVVVGDECRLRLRNGSSAKPQAAAVRVLVRSLEHLDVVLSRADRPAGVYCDFEDIRKHKEAVVRCNAAAMEVTLATVRVVKPGEDGFLKQLADCGPDAVLVRNLAAIEFYRETMPGLPLVGDYSLNVTNEWTADLLIESGLKRIVPGYDLNWQQMSALLSRFPVEWFEVVVHQHMPMFHMEHCVFAHTMSTGKDYRDCGRPCERHEVSLRDRVGEPHPLLADVGCRNTVYNAKSQSAAELLPAMVGLGVREFRVELLRQPVAEVNPLLDRYADILAGRIEPKAAMRSLRVIDQLGVTAGTFGRE